MEEAMKDIEAPKAVEDKGDDLSVDDTKSLDTTSDRTTGTEDSIEEGVVEAKDVDSGNVGGSSAKRCRPVVLLVMLVIVIGLAIGLGVGLTNKNSSFGFICNYNNHSQKPSEPDSASSSGDAVEPVDPEESIDSELPFDPVKDPVGVDDNKQRMQWPELLGMPGTDAVQFLEEEYGDTYEIVTVPHGGMYMTDFRTDRIVLWLDESGNVMMIPQVG